MHELETASRPRRTLPAPARIPAMARRGIAVAAVAALLCGQAGSAYAQAGKLPILRDAETEELLRDYARPVLKAAGLQQQNVEIVIINSREFNAFVADGRRIFINYGALLDAATPNQIIGVLAHESGHIAGGHLARIRETLASAQTAALVALLIGAAALGAGAATNAQGIGQAAPGIIMGPQEVIRRTLLSYQRSQEEAADRAAVSYLNATGQSANGMLATFARFQQQQLFLTQQVDPYLLSHPTATNRIAQLESLAKASPYFNKKDPPELQHRHDMMRAKISGFFEKPEVVARRYPSSNHSLPAQYARAMSNYRWGNVRAAVAQADALIATEPRNPYFHELKGQILLESGRAKEAIAPLRRAVELSRGTALIRMLLGQALVQGSQDKADAEEAIRELRFALQREPNASFGHRQLAVAYARTGDRANADLSSAYAAFNNGDFKAAKTLAIRAQRSFKVGTPGWLRADDIVKFEVPKVKNSNR
ncbi:MAG: M48 family metallopeptidase [Xanthobacteraceae bacterium]|nr:M48 family metallopeptidase [Xanthobacteraceae bacterium]MBX3523404.1 M48 family metallopeptidase [Xanthobacteraceae bacterium]MBX3534057.1 M48 family metallopeptidase [Xanthobacteraceae bacterium]MBX3548790.1 M48 family metallopeptidase [Xanthobacteraceae bacterium]MCW5678738.1 M48 family metallopeptidase [Xanthobacteraceae bacterium]